MDSTVHVELVEVMEEHSYGEASHISDGAIQVIHLPLGTTDSTHIIQQEMEISTEQQHSGTVVIHQLPENTLETGVVISDGLVINQVSDNTVETIEVSSEALALHQATPNTIQAIHMPSHALSADFIPANTLLTLQIPPGSNKINTDISEESPGPDAEYSESLEETMDISQDSNKILNPLTGELEDRETDEEIEETNETVLKEINDTNGKVTDEHINDVIGNEKEKVINEKDEKQTLIDNKEEVTDEKHRLNDSKIDNANDMDFENTTNEQKEEMTETNVDAIEDGRSQSIDVKAEKELGANDTPFMCGLCLKRFDKLSVFYAHIQTHDNFDRYLHSCERSKMLEALNVKEKVDNNLYKCSICQMAFPSMCLLHEHMVKDENVKDYKYSHEIQAAVLSENEAGAPDTVGKEIFKPDGTVITPVKTKQSNKGGNKVVRTPIIVKDVKKDKTTTVNAELSKTPDSKTPINKKGGVKSQFSKTVTRSSSKAKNSAVLDVKEDDKNAIIVECEATEKNITEQNADKETAAIKIEIKQEPVEIPLIPHSYGTRHSNKKRAASKTRAGLKAFTESHEGKYQILESGKIKKEVKVSLNSKYDKIEETNVRRRSRNALSVEQKEDAAVIPENTPVDEKILENNGDDVANTTKSEDDAMEVGDGAMGANEDEEDKKPDESIEQITTFTSIPKKPGWTCDTCGKVILTRATMRKHRIVHITTRNFHCEKCDKSFKSRSHLLDHMRRTAHKRETCMICGPLKEKESLKLHMKTFHPGQAAKLARINTLIGNVAEILSVEQETSQGNEVNSCPESPADAAIENDEEELKTDILEDDEKTSSNQSVVEEQESKKREATRKKKKGKKQPYTVTNSMDKIVECPVCKKLMSRRAVKKHQVVHVKTRDFQCRICGKSYKSKGHLLDHIRRIEHKKEIRCNLCEKMMKNIDRHMIYAHGITPSKDYDPDYEVMEEAPRKPCTECGEMLTESVMLKHMKIHGKDRPYECEICNKGFKTKSHLKDHESVVHVERTIPCEICLKKFKTEKQVRNHQLTHLRMNEEVKVEAVEDEVAGSTATAVKVEDLFEAMYKEDAALTTEEEMEDVITDMANPGTIVVDGTKEVVKVEVFDQPDLDVPFTGKKCVPFSCKICSKVCNDYSKLMRHMLVHKVTRDHICRACGARFKCSEYLKDHIQNVHIAEKSYVCNICGVGFKTNKSLWHHKTIHLNPTNEFYSAETVLQLKKDQQEKMKMKVIKKRLNNMATRVCDVCGITVMSKRFSRHRSIHRKTKDFECDICHKKYITQRYVNDHKKKVHTQSRDICDVCGQFFKGKQSLLVHRQTHGPKDKQCPKCDRMFTTNFYLKVHLNTHEPKKRFKCEQCDAAFSHKPRLDIHMVEKHSIGERRPCKYCGLTFPSRQKARLHERKAHEGYKDNMGRKLRRAKARALRREQKMAKYEEIEEIEELQEELLEVNDSVERVVFTNPAGPDGGTVEHILEIPENTEQCQILLFPNGTFKVLNSNEGQEAVELVTGEIAS